MGQPRLRGQPIRALREVRQGSHCPITQARASRAPQRAIAPTQAPNIDKIPPSALTTHSGTVFFCITEDDVEDSSMNTGGG